MWSRGFSDCAIEAAVHYGRVVRVRSAKIYALGRKEVAHCKRQGVDVSAFEGIQVVCTPHGTVLTVYRNHDFRGMRPKRKKPHRRRR